MISEKLAIIVPYQNREEQLYKFLGHMDWYLGDKFENYTIYIVEQESPTLFNYGALCNAAVDILKDEGYSYFIFHDIDLLPQEGCDYSNLNIQYPTHISSKILDIHKLKPYPHYTGGVFKISKEHFERINGFSNDYWGGGFEYLDLLYRMNKVIPDNLPIIKFFNKDIFEYHRFIDIVEVDSEIKKKINSFICSNGNSLFIQPNTKLDYVFSDSFTVSFDIFVDDDQLEDGCIVGKEGYDSGVFIKNNEAIVFQHWTEDGEIIQIWNDNSILKNKWTNVTIKLSTSNGIASMYFDGKLVNETFYDNTKNLMDFSQKNLWIGSLSLRNRFKGKISNLCIFDYDLTQTEIEMLYSNNYDSSLTTFTPILNIPFSKSVGQFFVDTQEFKSNAKIIKMDNSVQGNEEEQKYSYKIKMPSEDFGKYKILENSNKFTILEKYYWEEKDDNMIENEKILFYETTKQKTNSFKFGLSSIKYKLKTKQTINNHSEKLILKLK